jgi:hypothetical protein
LWLTERQGTRFARPAVLLSALLPVSGAPALAAPDGFPDHLDFSVNTTETSM